MKHFLENKKFIVIKHKELYSSSAVTVQGLEAEFILYHDFYTQNKRTREVETSSSSSKNLVSITTLPLKQSNIQFSFTFQLDNNNYMTYLRTFAGIIFDSGAASIKDCQVLVELGITCPNSKNHSSKIESYGDTIICQ